MASSISACPIGCSSERRDQRRHAEDPPPADERQAERGPELELGADVPAQSGDVLRRERRDGHGLAGGENAGGREVRVGFGRRMPEQPRDRRLPVRFGRRGGRPAEGAVRLDDVHHAHVGHGRGHEAGQAGQAVVEVERGPEDRARLEQEPEPVPGGLGFRQGLVDGNGGGRHRRGRPGSGTAADGSSVSSGAGCRKSSSEPTGRASGMGETVSPPAAGGGAAPPPGPAERAPFVLGQSAPDAGVLAGGHCPFEAIVADEAVAADRLAASICRAAGPVVPTGKNSSGSSSRQRA